MVVRLTAMVDLVSFLRVLDIEATRRKFNDWVRSPAFDATFNASAKLPKWPFIVGAVLIVSVAGALPGVGLLIYGFILYSKRKSARRDAHLAFSGHQPILCGIVIVNRHLLQTRGAIAPALLVGGFGAQDEERAAEIADAAATLGELYGEEPGSVPPELRQVCLVVNDDAYQPNRRRPLPPPLGPGKLLLFDTILQTDFFAGGSIDTPFVVCMASTKPDGTILQLPSHLAVFTAPREIAPNVIRHSVPTSAPPLVAPHSDNLEAVERHIATHLGEPASVFHELVSTTVHIDVHIVRATPERPWISLVTSGMSDLPMTVPEGAEDWRFAELMIRLPADWPLGEEAFKDERNYWPVRWLKQLARFPHELESWLSYGHSIPNGDPPGPIAPGVPFAGMILSAPWIGGEAFSTLYLGDGTPVRFWSLIPLHPSEIDFKLKYGSEELFNRLAAAGASDLVDVQRAPVA
jgi:hypothetical protein